MTGRVWLLVVLVLGLGGAVSLSAANSFTPGVEDVKDPLGRPSSLAESVIFSASEFERITSDLVPKHGTLSQRIQRLGAVADNLAVVVDDAGTLPGASERVNGDTATVNRVAVGLPGLIRSVTERAVQATPVVGDLGESVAGVTTELENVQTQLDGAFGDLAALGPRADTIVGLLADIQTQSARVRSLGPLLSALAGPLEQVYDLPVISAVLDLLFGRTRG